VRLVERRIGLLFAVFLVLLLFGLLRAGWLATVRAEDLGSRAAAQQTQNIVVPARRGRITDRYGVELAVAEDATTVFANPFLIGRPERVAARIAPLVGRPPADLARILADRGRGFAYLARKIPPDRGDAIERMGIEGIGTLPEPRRRYPRGTLAGQLLGNVGTDDVGLSGLEGTHEDTLHGRDGARQVVKDAMGTPLSLVEKRRAQPGKDLRLTIDATLQEKVESVLAGIGRAHQPKGATALVMDPRTGEILAAANWPAVDPNRAGSTPAYIRQNRTVAAAYEPGSTFKAFTVAGAMEERLVTPRTKLGLPPTIQVADRTIKESHERGYETLTVAKILAESSNIGSVKIGLGLGPQRFDRWTRRFGFGGSTGVDVPGESAGIVPRPADYSGSTLGNLPIGQGIAVTPIQMAKGYAAIANRGLAPVPHVVAGRRPRPRRMIAPRTAGDLSRMLQGVLGPGGTAEEASVPGYTLAGKTGTAQKPENGGYSESKYVGSFIGFAPARDPRLLVAVAVDEPKGAIYGGVVAAPAFEQIVSFALPYMRIPPR
jgi:cell division protein FtsI/penicillin-binding protein 2